MVILVMGVAGAGKSTIGEALAKRLGWVFLEADDDHPPENIAKMAAGIPLTDADRVSWLENLRTRIRQHVAAGENVTVACSALKEKYRDYLRDVPTRTVVVFLDVGRAVLEDRLRYRRHHFAHVDLLESQLQTLEEPKNAIVIDAARPITENVEEIVRRLPPV